MNLNTVPTKGNLMSAKSSLALARQGYELMDKKRNILVREIMDLNDQAKAIQRLMKLLSLHILLWKKQTLNWV